VRGFSLLELVLVLAMLAVAAAVAGPAIGRALIGASASAEVSAVAGFLRAAREQAVSRGHALEVRFDHDAHTLVVRRADRDADAGVLGRRVVSPALRVDAGPAPARVIFHAHGMSSGARVLIAAAGARSYVIAVDPLTGRVRTRRAGS
jgi:prepilin-type N-terminal cleavage/methylation domain-containing protein